MNLDSATFLLNFASLVFYLSEKGYWYFGSIVGFTVVSIAQVTFTAVDFAFGDFRWGVGRSAVQLAQPA